MRAGMLPALALVALVLVAAPPAMADDPFSVTGQVTDRVGVLDGRESEVHRAITRLAKGHSADLYVVYVDDFSGFGGEQWAAETVARSRLGVNGILLAVATGERRFQLDVDHEYPLSEEQRSEIMRVAIRPAFAENDWAAGAIGAADGLSAVLGGRPVEAPEITPGDPEPDGRDVPWSLIAIIAVAVVGIGGYLVARSWRGRREPGVDPSAMTVEELDKRAGSMLIRADDAIKTSEKDLGFARAEFGDDATAPFTAALEEAERYVDESFRLRGRLDDATPDDAATRRAMLEEIVRLLNSAGESLDSRAAAFDRLRDPEGNAPEMLERVMAVATEARARVSQTRSSLEAMSERYAAAALEAVAANGEQAASLLEFVDVTATEAREKLTAGDRRGAAVALVAAQEAAAQADDLMEAVDRIAADLDEVARGLRDAVKDTAQDLAEAEGLLVGGQQTPELAGRVAAAEHALNGVRQELESGRFDPIGASRRIELANLSLGDILEGVRGENAWITRAEASLEQTMLAARAEISAASDFVTTRRGGVGCAARTRLAVAKHTLTDAVELARSDPVGALKRSHHAHEQAARAMRLARADVGAFDPRAGGMLGVGAGTAAAMLGGILIDATVGEPEDGGRSPGSFGGPGTRSRRGAGGS